jgi:hypothetical protein
MHSRGPNSFAFGRDGEEGNNTIVFISHRQRSLSISLTSGLHQKKPL